MPFVQHAFFVSSWMPEPVCGTYEEWSPVLTARAPGPKSGGDMVLIVPGSGKQL